MQHAAIDSNSTAPIFTGISFSSVSSSSNPFGQYKANLLRNGALAHGTGAPRLFAPRSGLPQPEIRGNRFVRLRAARFCDDLMTAHNIQNSLNMRCRHIMPAAHNLEPCGAQGKGFGSCLK